MSNSLFASASRRLAAPSPMRSLLVVAAVALLSLVVACVVASRQLLREIALVEQSATRQQSALALQAYEADLDQLQTANREYAELATVQRFARAEAGAQMPEGFAAATIKGMHVDVILIKDAGGQVLYSAMLNRNTGALSSPAPAGLLTSFGPYASNGAAFTDLAASDRTVSTAIGMATIAASDIKQLDKAGSVAATVLFARFVQPRELARYRSASRLGDMTLSYIRNLMPQDGSILPTVVADWIASGGDGATSPTAVVANKIASYMLLRTPDKQPVALLAFSFDRTFYAAGFRTTWLLLAGIAAMILVFGASLVTLVIRLQRSYLMQRSIEARYQKIAAQVGESILLVDAGSLAIVDANEAALAILATTRDVLITRSAMDIYPDLSSDILAGAGNANANANAGRVIATSRLLRPDGSFGQCEVSITQLHDRDQELLCLVGHDISHRIATEEQHKANQKRLLHLAQHDQLTGLPNRLYLRARLPRVLKFAAQNERSLALIYLDVDHFKNINDSRGHDFGDTLLKVVAQRLRNTVGTQDAVVRMGGDEFVIVASLRTDQDALDGLAQRLHDAVSAPMSIDGVALTVTASIGVSVYPRDGLDLEVLLKHADIALYQAKEAGRNCYRLFVADMDLRVSEDVALEQALRHAIGTDQLYMEYQPVVDLRTSRVTSFEALMRWRHPDLGVVPPGRFVPIADKSGLMLQLGQHAISQTLKQLSCWLAEGLHCVPIAVNVAPQQLTRTDFPKLVKQLALAADVEASWLRFEITESALLKDPEQLIETLAELRKLGCQVLIDDFGTGYSALSYLTQLPVDALKIDRSFVTDMVAVDASAQIIRAVIDMARRLEILTVAEGVETKDQALLLRKMGCNSAQGYLFSRPLSPRRSRILLERMRAKALAKEEAEPLLSPDQYMPRLSQAAGAN